MISPQAMSSITGSVTIAGNATEDATLTADNDLVDANGLGPVSYQWLADGVPIADATTDTLTLTQAEVGKAISVTASYEDGLGQQQSVTSAPTTPVENLNDEPSGELAIDGSSLVGWTLTVSDSLDDEDGMGPVSYQWLANGLPIEGAVSDTLLLTEALGGAIISVRGSYVDGQGTAESVDSDGTAIALPGAGFSVAILDGRNGFRIDMANVLDGGYGVGDAGDVNGDGFDDLVLGSFAARPNGIKTGAAYVVFGQADGYAATLDVADLDGTNGFRLEGIAENDSTGFAVSGAGDLNGDGFADIVIGADGADSNGDRSGSAYVVFGRAAGFAASLPLADLDGVNGFRVIGENPGDALGLGLGAAGDINGDGFDDLALGGYRSSVNGDSAGAGYVVFGKAGGFDGDLPLDSLDGSNGFRFLGESAGDSLGYSISGAGDVNGDGIADLIVGADNADFGGDGSGSAYVIFGQAVAFPATLALADLDGSNGFRVDGEERQDDLGFSVSGAGDVNGDGFADLIIGASNAGSDFIGPGYSYVVFGQAAGFDAVLDLAALDGSNGFRLEGVLDFDGAGRAVSGAGDFNGDGFDDLLVGARDADSNGNRAGSSYLVYGKSAPFAASVELGALDGNDGFRIDGAPGDGVGRPVSAAGDINNDGYGDLIVDAPGADYNGFASSSAYVIFGSTLPFGRLVEGGPGRDYLLGTSGGDVLLGFSGRDTLEGLAGDDQLNGGDFIDHALFQEERLAYTIVNESGQLSLTGPVSDGNDSLVNLERLHFSDLSLAFDLDGNAGKSVKLLGAMLGADQATNEELVGIALDIFDNEGLSFEQVMDIALDVVLGPNATNGAVVDLIWQNLVGGPTPQDLRNDLVNDMNAGAFTQAQLAVLAAEHPINLENIGLVGLTEFGVEYAALG